VARTNDNEELRNFTRMDIRGLLPLFGWSEVSAADARRVRHPGRPGDIFTDGGRVMHTFRAKDGETFMFKMHDGSQVDGRDVGTIIHVVQDCLNCNIGRVRKELRAVTGTDTHTHYTAKRTLPNRTPTHPYLSPIAADDKKTKAQLIREYEAGSETVTPGIDLIHVLRAREINLVEPQFSRDMRREDHWNVRFPYYRYETRESKRLEFAGFETVTSEKKRYTKGGYTGIWVSGWMGASTVVITESPSDAMAYRALTQLDAIYVAVRMGAEIDAAQFVINAFDAKLVSKVILATDNDAAGLTYAGKIWTELNKGAKNSKRYTSDLEIIHEQPMFGHNDHCDVLRDVFWNSKSEFGTNCRDWSIARHRKLRAIALGEAFDESGDFKDRERKLDPRNLVVYTPEPFDSLEEM